MQPEYGSEVQAAGEISTQPSRQAFDSLIGQRRVVAILPSLHLQPDKKLENKLKRITWRAGLNCGRCISKYGNKCSEGSYCGKWFLHKFRHTFATNSLEEGVSIRTLQEWLGHSDLASTMVYLKYVGRQGVHEIIDKSAMAELAVNSFRSVPASPALRPD